MTGSGNDFVFFDGREVSREVVTSPEAIKRICNRHNGIGADGLVYLESSDAPSPVVVHYFNSDGTAADLCGNATLCSTALSAALGIASRDRMELSTGAGIIRSRVSHADGLSLPEIDLRDVAEIRLDVPIELGPGERRLGFAVAGIPHLVILCDDAEAIDVMARGPFLRWHQETGPKGANVNWVSRLPDGRWRYRTFERGVEGETLACGTGAVATGVLLTSWGLAAGKTTTIVTSSGRELLVQLEPLELDSGTPGRRFRPTLRGEGRVVYRGVTESL
ncbi:diaminopimelate epimerase [Gemmatimonas sp.]